MSMNNHKNQNINKHLGHEEENKDLCDTCYDRWENFNHKEEKKKEHGHEHGHEHNHPKGHEQEKGKEHGHEHGKKIENKNKVNKPNKK